MKIFHFNKSLYNLLGRTKACMRGWWVRIPPQSYWMLLWFRDFVVAKLLQAYSNQDWPFEYPIQLYIRPRPSKELFSRSITK